MTPPLLPPLILHGIAFAIGLGGAAFISKPQPGSPTPHSQSPTETSQRRDRNTNAIRLSSPSSFRAAYDSLIHHPMAEDDRNHCMQKLWTEWAASDPAGMLAFLENNRVWPKGLWICPLLSDHPELLLPFALRQGSSDAIAGLSYCDPSTVAQLLADLPEEQKGTEIHKLEKQVARNLGYQGIKQETPNPAYLSGVAQSLLEAGRVDEFFDIFQQVADPEELRNLAAEFGDALSEEKQDDMVFALFLRLPEKYRIYAAGEMTEYNGSGSSMEFPDVRQKHMRWLEKFAAAGFINEAASDVRHLFQDEDTSITTDEIFAWVSRFPEDGSWQPITEAIISSWHQRGNESTALVTQICKLPDGPAREALAMEVYARFHTGFGPSDEEDQRNRNQLTSLFITPQAKERFDKRFPQNENPDDPFAPVPDPFAPAGDSINPELDPFQK